PPVHRGGSGMAQVGSSSRADGARPTWKELVAGPEPLVLPAAHDALTARLIERAGFRAYQVGGFALDGTHYGVPDIDLTHFGEKSVVILQTIGASSLPVLVDADDGYGEGLRSARELKRVGKALAGTPLATTLMEGGGRLPWLPPEEIKGYGFSMILYPTTVVFRVARAIERALAGLKAGKPMPEDDAVDR